MQKCEVIFAGAHGVQVMHPLAEHRKGATGKFWYPNDTGANA